MKLDIEVKTLLDALKLAAEVRPRHGGAWWMQSVLLAASKEEDTLSIVATDGAVALELTRPADVRLYGQVRILPARLISALRTLPDDSPDDPAMVTLEAEAPEDEDSNGPEGDLRLIVRGGTLATQWELLAMDSGPDHHYLAMVERIIPDDDAETCSVKMDVRDLAAMLEQTSYACASEKGRYALNGVLAKLTPEEGESPARISMAAADGARLARAVIQLHESRITHTGGGSAPGWEAIVPPEALDQAIRGVRGVGISLTLAEETGTAYVSADGCRAAIQLIEGRFPDVDDVMPSRDDAVSSVSCAPEDLVLALRQAVVTGGGDDGRVLSWTIGGDGGCALLGRKADAGSSRAPLPGRHDGEEVEISFRADYLLDIARRATGESVDIYIKSPRDPVLVIPGPHVEAVISPIVRDDVPIQPREDAGA